MDRLPLLTRRLALQLAEQICPHDLAYCPYVLMLSERPHKLCDRRLRRHIARLDHAASEHLTPYLINCKITSLIQALTADCHNHPSCDCLTDSRRQIAAFKRQTTDPERFYINAPNAHLCKLAENIR